MKVLHSSPKARGWILGAGAHGRVVAAIWSRAEPNRELAFLDDNAALWDTDIGGRKVMGAFQTLSDLIRPGDKAILAIGNNVARMQATKRFAATMSWANVIDPSAVLMPGSSLGVGTLVGPQAVIHTGARVGNHAIINTAAVVEHDCIVEEGVSISPGVRMGGRVHIGKNAFLAAGVTLVVRARIGEGAVVGAGAVVTSDIPAGTLAYGVPARVIREVGADDWKRLF
jgi:sugar O-acyltransferase (sialic acid O-acetyltransferase NeuD family)